MHRCQPFSLAPLRTARAPPTLALVRMPPTRKKSKIAFPDLRNVGWIP
jgi:hypothetical protein